MHSLSKSHTNKAFNFVPRSASSVAHYPVGLGGTPVMNPLIASPMLSSNYNLYHPQAMILMNQQMAMRGVMNTNAAPTMNINNKSSQGSRERGTGNAPPSAQVSGNAPQRAHSSHTDRTPTSSVKWDKSNMSVSPISQNLSNPSVFFSHTGNNFISIGGGTPAGANN